MFISRCKERKVIRKATETARESEAFYCAGSIPRSRAAIFSFLVSLCDRSIVYLELSRIYLRYSASTLLLAHGVLLRKWRLDGILGSLLKHRI
jgi:hypothetical protein